MKLEARSRLWPLTARARVLLALLLLSLLSGGILSYESLRSVRTRSAWVTHSFEVLGASGRLLSGLQDAEIAQQSYLLSGNSTVLESYRAALSQYRRSLAELGQLTQDNPLEQRRLAELQPLVEARLDRIAAAIETTTRGYESAAKARAAAGEGRREMDEIRNRVAEIEATERSLLRARLERTEAAFRLAIAVPVVSTLLVAALFVLFARSARRDLLTRQRLEAELQQSSTELRRTLDALTIGVARCNRDMRYVSVNAACARIVGVPMEQIVGRRIEDVLGPEALEVIRPHVERVLQGESVRYEAELPYAAGARYMHVAYTPWTGADGRVSGWVASIEDISERKRAEQALRIAESALRDADRRKDEFLATLAHELRNPLAAIRNAAAVLKGGGAERREWAATMIDRQAQTMAWLLDELLDVSRITSGVLSLQKQRVNLAAVIKGVVESVQPMIDGRHHTLTVTVPGSIELEADPVRLEQVLSNLLTNAAKYTDPGGRIELRAERGDSSVCIAVKDSGIGLERDSLRELFTMFSQVKSALHRSEGGLGIGLALVKGLVELHGGSVEARSAGLGKGSEFLVHLPLPHLARARSASAVVARNAAAVRRRVLIADDNQDSAESLGVLLELAGHEVQLVHSGRAALEATRRAAPDVAIIDIGMPELNGYEVARMIRAADWGRSVQLTALTGWGQEEDKGRAYAAGFDAHLTKPVDPAVLEKLLADMPRAAVPEAAHLTRSAN